MSTDQLAGVHLERIRHHAPVDEYDQYLQRWIDDPVYRRMLRHYRDQFVVRYPDIEAWFASPLFERVGHEWWNARPPRSRRSLCHSARSYLHYLGLRGYVWFDWDWVLAIARHRIWELDERLGLTIHRDAEALVSEAVRLGYCAATARQTLQWTLSRLLLHRGDPRVNAITEQDLDDLTEAVQRFGERSDVATFYGSRPRYLRLTGHDHGYLNYVHALRVVLYHCHVSSNSPTNVQRIPHSWWR